MICGTRLLEVNDTAATLVSYSALMEAVLQTAYKVNDSTAGKGEKPVLMA